MRLLSSAAHAPLLGEACILFNLASRAAPGVEIVQGGTRIPLLVWVGLSLYFGLGLVYSVAALRELKRWCSRRVPAHVPLAKMQVAMWIVLVCVGVVLALSRSVTMGALAFLVAQMFPAERKVRK